MFRSLPTLHHMTDLDLFTGINSAHVFKIHGPNENALGIPIHMAFQLESCKLFMGSILCWMKNKELGSCMLVGDVQLLTSNLCFC